MRLFIAVTLPHETVRQLTDVQNQLRPLAIKGNFTPAENLHVTLKFLGEIFEDKVYVIKAIMDEIKHLHPSQGSIKQISTLKAANIVCAKMRFDDNLYKVEQYLTERLIAAGFSVEQRTYTPHVTLIRKYAFSAPFSQVSGNIKLNPEQFSADKITLYSTVFDGTGAPPVYREVYSVILSGRLGS